MFEEISRCPEFITFSIVMGFGMAAAMLGRATYDAAFYLRTYGIGIRLAEFPWRGFIRQVVLRPTLKSLGAGGILLLGIFQNIWLQDGGNQGLIMLHGGIAGSLLIVSSVHLTWHVVTTSPQWYWPYEELKWPCLPWMLIQILLQWGLGLCAFTLAGYPQGF